MARRVQTEKYQHSLWDRLTNPDLRGDDVGITPSSEAEKVKNEVRRDLEWLLNSRRANVSIPEGMTTLGKSLVTYGLPDFSSLSPHDPSERDRLLTVLEQAVQRFEPRLTEVRVICNPDDQNKARSLIHYRIEAMLRIDPAPEAIVFDTVLELGNRAFVVKREGT